MNVFKIFIPGSEEREHLGRFYWASLASEFLNIILPFQFVYLLLVLDKPSWAPIPLLVESLVIFIMEIPTGIIADRWGRKVSTMIGDSMSAVGWLMVPLTTVTQGWTQLVIACVAFGLEGLGQTLVSGAEQAWVMDNLIAIKKSDLTDHYFARVKSIGSLGGIFSGIAVWIVLLVTKVETGLINALWYFSAFGQFVSVAILSKIPEHVIAESERDREDSDILATGPSKFQAINGFKSILRIKPLLAFAIVTLIVAFAHSIIDDAFQISMVTKDLNPRELAPLAILTDVIGFIAPLLVIGLVRRFGAPNVLATVLATAAAAYLAFLFSPPLAIVVCLFLFTNLLRDLWAPVADATLHSFIPSANRATIGSIVNQFSELVATVGLGIFAFMLGKHAEELQEAIPDLVEAFAGVETGAFEIPRSVLGLPVYDAALVIFTFIGLVAAVILWVYPWHRSARAVSLDSPDELGLTDVDILKAVSLASEEKKPERVRKVSMYEETVDPVIKERLLGVKKALDRQLDHHNPGENLSWWVSDSSFDVPEHTLQQLRDVGPALHDFFRVANILIEKDPAIAKRLEKTFSPNYHRLNQAQPHARPRLIRPDVVCDQDWTPKLVELEITVGARADTAIMANQYGLDQAGGLIRAYADMAIEYGRQGKNLAFITAPHPFFQDLPDDARAFASLLKEAGAKNIVVLTAENLGALCFDGKNLVLTERFSEPMTIHVIDRFIDIYEVAELQHLGMGAILDAYLAGAIEDVNTCKQNIDEKDWMSLFWEPQLAQVWTDYLGEANVALLRKHIPKTWFIRSELTVLLNNGEEVPIQEIGDIRPELRRFVIKESGTSTTASGAQSFHVLHQMEREDIEELLEDVFESGIEYVLQELIESPRIAFTAIDPEDDRIIHQSDARVKMSPFYIDGKLSDIRFIASNKKYAVNDEDCVVGVVTR